VWLVVALRHHDREHLASRDLRNLNRWVDHRVGVAGDAVGNPLAGHLAHLNPNHAAIRTNPDQHQAAARVCQGRHCLNHLVEFGHRALEFQGFALALRQEGRDVRQVWVRHHTLPRKGLRIGHATHRVPPPPVRSDLRHRRNQRNTSGNAPPSPDWTRVRTCGARRTRSGCHSTGSTSSNSGNSLMRASGVIVGSSSGRCATSIRMPFMPTP
jgi:hypothetical protein